MIDRVTAQLPVACINILIRNLTQNYEEVHFLIIMSSFANKINRVQKSRRCCSCCRCYGPKQSVRHSFLNGGKFQFHAPNKGLVCLCFPPPQEIMTYRLTKQPTNQPTNRLTDQQRVHMEVTIPKSNSIGKPKFTTGLVRKVTSLRLVFYVFRKKCHKCEISFLCVQEERLQV